MAPLESVTQNIFACHLGELLVSKDETTIIFVKTTCIIFSRYHKPGTHGIEHKMDFFAGNPGNNPKFGDKKVIEQLYNKNHHLFVLLWY